MLCSYTLGIALAKYCEVANSPGMRMKKKPARLCHSGGQSHIIIEL